MSPHKPRILVLGATGQVGWELCRVLSVQGVVTAVSRSGSGPNLDLSQLAALPAWLDQCAPDVIVNAAAYTAVDKAESEPEEAAQLNARLPAVLADWASGRGIPVLHYSTDYVFDGQLDRPYRETDPTAPLSVYGRTKLEGDQALLDADVPVWILRVSWVYGRRGQNFLRTMQRLMAEREQLSIVDDQIGAPTWSRNIAEASGALLAKLLADPGLHDTASLYHLSPQGQTSWFGFAEAIRQYTGLDCRLQPIASSDYPTAARRPLNSRLDSSLMRERFGIALPDWEQALRDCLAEMSG